MSSTLEMWVVYDKPDDFPEHFVARKWLIRAEQQEATDVAVFGNTLPDVREMIPVGLHRLERNPADDVKIVEVWL